MTVSCNSLNYLKKAPKQYPNALRRPVLAALGGILPNRKCLSSQKSPDSRKNKVDIAFFDTVLVRAYGAVVTGVAGGRLSVQNQACPVGYADKQILHQGLKGGKGPASFV